MVNPVTNAKVSLHTSASMCIKSTKFLSNDNPTSEDTTNPTVVINEDHTDPKGEKISKKVPYQNVTLAGTPLASSKYANSPLNKHSASSASSQFKRGHSHSNNLFQLSDKESESQSKSAKKRDQWLLQHERAVSTETIETTTDSTSSIPLSPASFLSGGCVINLMTASPVITVHHHHHHHFNEDGQIKTLTTTSPEIPSSNLPSVSSSARSSVALPTNSTLAPSTLPQIQSSSSVTQTLAPSIRNLQSNRNANLRLSNIHHCLNVNKQLLEQCGFYYGAINWSQSTELLRRTSEGTFLVRESSDSRFLYTLSVQRKPEDGPTSVRIHFAHGKFRLDADEQIEDLMPKFDSVLDLVDYYSSLSKSNRAKSHIWIDREGTFYSPICLKKPLIKEVPTLAHAARLAVHQSLKSQGSVPELKLPNQIINFLTKYPHGM